MANNIITATFTGCQTSVWTSELYQWDYGQVLQFEGIDLPEAYEVHFSTNPTSGTTETRIGNSDGVVIPNTFLTTGGTVYAWVYLHDSVTDGETEYMVTIPIKKRPQPSTDEPTPEQETVITEAIVALNNAVEQTGADVQAATAAAVAAEASEGAAEQSAAAAASSEENAAQSAEAATNNASAAAESARIASEAAQSVAGGTERAEQAARDAETAKETAQSAATQAAQSAVSASTSATQAAGSATSASGSAANANTSAQAAAQSAGTATTKAAEAAQSAQTASTAATNAANAQAAAETAQSAAESAKTAAQSAQTAAETAVQSVAGKSAQIDQNTADIAVIQTDITDLKEDLSELTDRVIDIGDNTTLGLYGAKWDRLTDRLTRLFQAADITIDTTNFCHKGALNTNYDNPFDSIYPWSEMKVCNVDLTKYRSGNYSLKDCITAVYGDPDFTYEGTETIFVGRYRPEFWYKSMEDGDGNVYYLVSQIERTGFEHAPEAIDGISFCVDAGNSKVTAGSGIPLTNIAVSQIHARAKNSGFTLQDIYTIDQQIILYLVEYANMNIQNAIGDGCSSCYRENDADTISNVTVTNGETTFDVTDSAMAQYMQVGCQIDIGATRGAVTYKGLLKSYSVSGTTCTITLDRELAVTNGMFASVHGFSACEYDMIAESIGNASGYIGTNNKANAFYRGALLYANRYSYILGVYRQTGTNRIWLCPKDLDPDDYDAINTSVHSDTGVALPDLAAGAWVTVGGNAQRIDGLSAFMATGESSGSSASPVGDQQYVPVPSAGNTILLFGCSAHNGWVCGVFGGAWDSASGHSWWYRAGLPILK